MKLNVTDSSLPSVSLKVNVVKGSADLINGGSKQHVRIWLPRVIGLAAVVVLLSGAGLSLQTLYNNKRVTRVAARAVARANAGQPSPAPSTIKQSPASVATYTVPPHRPRYLIIPKLTIHARILPVGLTTGGTIGSSSNVYDTAWYNGSSLPGQQGAMLIDGHISSWTTRGVFYGLKNLKPGDSIQVERGDGTVFNYKVVKNQLYDEGTVDMHAATTPIVPGTPGLNLISCSGQVISGTSEFNKRIVVYTEQVGP